jgi:hypothetical protein
VCFRERHQCRAKTASRGEVRAAADGIGFGGESILTRTGD